MRSMYKANISANARWVSTIGGAALAAAGYRRSNRALGALGMGLVARGLSGYCPVTAAVAGDREDYFSNEETRRRLGGTRGVIVEEGVAIRRPATEVYSCWRRLENLPRFMSHLERVEVLDGFRSRWVAAGPLGASVAWTAEIINDIPGSLISWKSVGDSEVATAGSVRFKPVGENTTEVRVKLQYDPPAGKAGASVAWLLGADPQQQIADDLRRFKDLVETGEESTVTYRTTQVAQRTRREADVSELGTESGSGR